MKRRSSKSEAAAAAPVRAPRRRVAVGPPRPQYLLSEENDRMMAIITALAAEVSALRDRLDSHEALGEKRRFPTARGVERYRLSEPRRAARERERQEMLARVFRILLEDLESARHGHVAAGKILAAEVSAS
jgi:hypothetical protein